MELCKYPHLEEAVYRHTLPNGLPILVLPRPGFTKKLSYFVTDYGSIYTKFSVNGTAYTTPDGVAHYLEHKLFDMPDRDISAEFAQLGAHINAFTSYDMTAYYFSCTDHFDACLRLLLQFVSTPYFTAESVAKEQGIIGQEIEMNADLPDSVVFEQLMQAMYKNHPIRTPILGTRESIANITPEVLTACHKAFYRPDNMLLCIVGDVDPENVVAIAQEILPDAPEDAVEKDASWPETMTVATAEVETKMDVAMPMFQLGFKCPAVERGDTTIRRELIGEFAAEALFGESSALYLQLYQDGLIDASFGGGYETVEGMCMLTASGDSRDPRAVREAILAQVEKLLETGIPEKDFLRMKRSAMGRRIRGLDNFSSTCFRLCAYHFSGFDYLTFPRLYAQVTSQEVLSFLETAVTRENCCLSIIQPC